MSPKDIRMIDFTSLLKSRRNKSLDKCSSISSFENIYFSGTTFSLWRGARNHTSRYSKGLVLDAGSGRGGWRDVIMENADKREALDWQALEGEELDWEADLIDMPHVPTSRFDTVICHQVLEHISEPQKALSEIYRVLKPGGHVVLSVPHLSRLHELPHDYFRYTPNGLRFLAETAGFEVQHLEAYGGMLTFIHHQFSTIFIGLASSTTMTGRLAIYLNAPLSYLSSVFDNLLDRRSYMPNGIIIVLRKK